MLPSKDSHHRTNQQLMQYKVVLEQLFPSEKLIKWTLDKFDDINAKLASTSYLELYYPHFIGNTALHFTYSKSNKTTDHETVLNLEAILRLGADFTLKNRENSTVLHLMLRGRNGNNFIYSNLRNVLDNPCINTILSAHVKTRNATNPCDSNGMSHFHIACMTNHIGAVEFFLDNNVSVDDAINSDSPYFAGFTPLHLAIRCCNIKVAKILLKHGASICLKNEEKMTAVHIIIDNHLQFANETLLGFFDHSDLPKKHANEALAKLLLEILENSSTTIFDESGISQLHLASTIFNETVIEEFLIGDINHSIKIDSTLWPGYTALHFAACVNMDTVKFLVKKGADLMAKDANGITSLDLCMERHKSTKDMFDILSLKTAWKEIEFEHTSVKLLDLISAMEDCKKFATILKSLPKRICCSVPIDSPLWPSLTPMHLLILFSRSIGNGYQSYDGLVSDEHLQMMKKLYERNVKLITATDIHGRTPLHLSFHLAKMKNLVDLLLTLLNNINFPLDLVDDEDLSLLHIACRGENCDLNLVKKLLLRSKNINLTYKGKSISNVIETGWTPLHLAVANRNVSIINILMKNGADVHSQDVNGVTPIHLIFLLQNVDRNGYRCEKIDKSVAILLSASNLKECVSGLIGLSHLHVACSTNNADAAKNLLDNGSDVNAAITCDSEVTDKSFELSKLVKYSGATPLQIIYEKHRFDLEHLKRSERIKILELLIQRVADIFIEDFKDFPFSAECLFEYFLENIKENPNLLEQAEAKFGLTKLHFACYLQDLEWAQCLLNNGADVNAKIIRNCSKWSAVTPLHVVITSKRYSDETKNEFVDLLLNNGADVTISNSKQETPLHIAFQFKRPASSILVKMMNAHKDFSINPTNNKGISHFHMACFFNETAIVKKFLQRGNLNVNQPIDFCINSDNHKDYKAGFSPLHLAAFRQTNEELITSQLQTVDLLLKNGADPNYESSYGYTPLHFVDSYEIFERIVRSGANANALDVYGDTPLGFFLTRRRRVLTFHPHFFNQDIKTDQLINWLRCGCNYNAFNIFDKQGYIGLSINQLPYEELLKLIKIVSINVPQAFRVDGKGRTVIHNFVSVECEDKFSVIQYATLIELLATTGYDIDCQDDLGRTALHLAAEFNNLKAISALLMVGADFNLPDINGETALAYHASSYCQLCSDNEIDEYGNRVNYERCPNFEIFANHARKMVICELEVCHSNRHIIEGYYRKTDSNQFYKELEETKNLKIKPHEITIRSLISETYTVADYPYMAQSKKDAIEDFFDHEKISYFREKFGEVAGLANLQYRKAVKRPELIENANISLAILADFQVPVVCSSIILGFLSNSDLDNLIASTNNCKGGETNN